MHVNRLQVSIQPLKNKTAKYNYKIKNNIHENFTENKLAYLHIERPQADQSFTKLQ